MDVTMQTPGSFCTAVLRTPDVERAAAFYSALVGWTTQEVSGTPGHRLLQFGGRTVASLHQIADGSNRWVPHVSVESIERTTADALMFGPARGHGQRPRPGEAGDAPRPGGRAVRAVATRAAPGRAAHGGGGQSLVDRGALEAFASRWRSPGLRTYRLALLFDELLKTDGLSDGQSADPNDGAVNSGGVLMRTNNRLQHLRIGTTRIWIKVDHRATNVAHRDAYAWPLARLAEQEDASQPRIFLEGVWSQ